MFIVASFITVRFKEIVVQLPEDGKIRVLEQCRSYVNECMHKLENSAILVLH